MAISLVVEIMFLGFFFYSCYVKDVCVVPFFFGVGKIMIVPMGWMGFSTTSIDQTCSINGEQINCSEIQDKEHFCTNGVCEMNGVCPGNNKSKSIQDCINDKLFNGKINKE
jgi:hypothetical protein